MDKTGVSWNKRYKHKHGAVRGFLLSLPDIFVVEQGTVTLTAAAQAADSLEKLAAMDAKDSVAGERGQAAAPVKPAWGKSEPVAPAPRHDAWFEFNDNTVSPIHKAAIEGSYAGSACAYMLFYARRGLLARLEAPTLPDQISEAVAKANAGLAKQRLEYDEDLHRISINIAHPSMYTWDGCALRPLTPAREAITSGEDDPFKISVDQRISLQEFQLLATAHLASLGRTVHGAPHLNRLREVYAGLWYPDGDLGAGTSPEEAAAGGAVSPSPAAEREVSEDNPRQGDASMSLVAAGLDHLSTVLVWDGKDVEGDAIQCGPSHAPIDVNCTHLFDSVAVPRDEERDEDGAEVPTSPEAVSVEQEDFTLFLAKSATLGELRDRIAAHLGVTKDTMVLHRMDRTLKQAWGAVGKAKPEAVAASEDGRTLAQLEFAKGIKVTVEEKRPWGPARALQLAEEISRAIVVTVRNKVDAGAAPAVLRPSVDPAMTIGAFKALVVQKLQSHLPSLATATVQLRLVTDDTSASGLAKLLVDEEKTLAGSNITASSELVLQAGALPAVGDGEVIVRFGLGLKAREEMDRVTALAVSAEIAAQSAGVSASPGVAAPPSVRFSHFELSLSKKVRKDASAAKPPTCFTATCACYRLARRRGGPMIGLWQAWPERRRNTTKHPSFPLPLRLWSPMSWPKPFARRGYRATAGTCAPPTGAGRLTNR